MFLIKTRGKTVIDVLLVVVEPSPLFFREHLNKDRLREDGTQVFHRPVMHLVDSVSERILIRDTDTGEELREQISNLEALFDAFKSGLIKENY